MNDGKEILTMRMEVVFVLFILPPVPSTGPGRDGQATAVEQVGWL